MFAKKHYVFLNGFSCKNHVPGRETAAVHCITLYENVENPGHSSRSLRNNISFAMQIVVRNRNLNSSGPKAGHRGVCVAMGLHGGALGPPWGPRPQPGPQAARFIGFGPSWPTGRRVELAGRQVVGASSRRVESAHRSHLSMW